MSRPHLNLFAQAALKYESMKSRERKLMRLSLAGSVATCVLIMVAYLIQLSLLSEIRQSQQQTANLERTIDTQLAQQLQLSVIASRLRLIDAQSSQDLNYVKYRSVLTDAFAKVEVPWRMRNFSMSGIGAFDVRVAFDTQDDMLEFVRVLDSDSFRRSISKITVSDVTIDKSSSPTTKKPSLTIRGTFL